MNKVSPVTPQSVQDWEKEESLKSISNKILNASENLSEILHLPATKFTIGEAMVVGNRVVKADRELTSLLKFLREG